MSSAHRLPTLPRVAPTPSTGTALRLHSLSTRCVLTADARITSTVYTRYRQQENVDYTYPSTDMKSHAQ